MSLPFQGDHWLPGFNFNVEEWDAKGQAYETLAICRTLALARAAFEAAIAEKPGSRRQCRLPIVGILHRWRPAAARPRLGRR